MASSNTAMSIVWLLILIFVSLFVAGICAMVYIILYCIEACVPDLKVCHLILFKVTLYC